MKLSIIILVASCLQVAAEVSLAQQVSLDAEHVPLHEILREIRKQAKVDFLFKTSRMAQSKRVSIHAKAIDLQQALHQVFSDQPVAYVLTDNAIVVIDKPIDDKQLNQPIQENTLLQQNVHGSVKDAKGEPLVGVSVLEKGTTKGTTTDAQGNFLLTVSSTSAVLVFRFIGYNDQEIMANTSAIRVIMEESVNDLSEVVIVGYSAQRKENITGSVATVSSEELHDVTSPNVSNLLQGKVAGLSANSGTGKPGELPTVRIRGVSSISASQNPIWVVDGVIQPDVPNLNPQDIETISVLKDASSAALYGSRGANGVVVVTTKTAKAEQTTISLATKTGFSSFNTGGFKLMDGPELYQYWASFANQDELPEWYSENLLQHNTNWIELGTHDGLTQDYNLSLLGGTAKTKVFAGMNYFNEDGSVKGLSFDRYTGRLNLDYKLGDKITLSPKLSGSYSKTQDQQHNINGMFTYLPWDNPFDASGAVVNAQAPGANWRGRDLTNYFYDLQWNYTQESKFNAMANVDLTYKILPFLEFKSTNNITYYNTKGFIYKDPQSIAGLAVNGQIENSNAYRTTRFTNQMLTFTKDYGQHSINALIAYEFNDYKYEDNSAIGTGIVPGIKVLSGASNAYGVDGETNDYAFQSYLMNANYSYANRYVLQGSFRRDGSSRFGSNSKYGNFFSVSGAWNVHQERFFHSNSINFLRLKAAYGGVGNTPETLYPQYELFAVNAQYNGEPTAFPSSLGNPNLTWEKTYATNIGLETGFFNRINLSLEWYQKSTSGLLHFVPLPYVSGYEGYWDNIGSVHNKGIELTLNAQVIQSAQWKWDVDVNLGINTNKVNELYGGERQLNGNQVIEEGYDVNTWYMRKWAGVNPEDGTPQWEKTDEQTGEVSLTGNYAEATLQHVGNATPDYFGGLNTRLSYNHWFLNGNIAFSHGALIYNGGRELFDSDGAYATYNQMELQNGWSRWTPDHHDATHPQAFFGGNNRSNGVSSRYLEDGSFLRIRNIALGYKWNTKWLAKLKIKSLNTSLSVDNLLTITDYSGLDPEAATTGSTTSPYPLPRRFMLGIDVQF
ncbi:TonB-dependent receptor [Olivibacter ginsenosidimutans]